MAASFPGPLPALVCLPPAGAGPGLFRPWSAADPAVIAPAIPGREALFSVPAADSLEALADRLADDLAPRLPARYGLFGYSMGGTVAYLLAERLAARGLPGPEAVFVLGALAPHRLHEGTEDLHALPDPAFWAEIAKIGGTPPEILADAEMRALLGPILRGDFRLCARHRHREGGFLLRCPVHVFVAGDDHLVPQESAGDWYALATTPVRPHRIAGGHMLSPAAFAQLREDIRALWPGTPVAATG